MTGHPAVGLDALLARLQARTVTPVTPAANRALQPKPAPLRACTPVTPVTSPNRNGARADWFGLQLVEFRTSGDPVGVWHTALGPDADDLIADLRDRYRDRLSGVRKVSDSEPER